MLIASEVYERKDNFSSAWIGFKALNEFGLPDGIRYVIVGRQFNSYNWGSRMAYDLIAEGNVADQLNGIATLLDYQVLPSGSDYVLSPIGSAGTTTGWYYDAVSDVTYYGAEEITAAVQIVQLNYSGLIEQWLDVPPQGTSTRQVARAYFDIPPQGQGTVTLSIKRPGQTLNFSSSVLGTSVTQMISGDSVINIEAPYPSIFENGAWGSGVMEGVYK